MYITIQAMDRAALVGCVEAYLDALVARDPARLAFSHHIKFTENGQKLAVGDGFWATCNGSGQYRHIIADPVTQQAATICVMYENDRSVIFGLRVKVEGGEIVDAETIVSRDPLLFNSDGPERLERLGTPLPIWSEPVPMDQRASRDDMAAVANAYLRALEANDGSKVAPLAPDVDRWDNGMKATNAPELDPPGSAPFYALGAAQQLAEGYFQFVTGVREQRFPLIDEELGVVFAVTFLDHAGTIHEAKLSDGRVVPIAVKQPFSWHIMDMFKVRGGKIHQMEVLLNKCFYGMTSGW